MDYWVDVKTLISFDNLKMKKLSIWEANEMY